MNILIDAFGGDNAPLEVIRGGARAVQELGVTVTLVGDTRFDVEGAREENVGCVAVSYGYGTRQELEAARAPRILDSVAAVERYFLERIR